MTSAKQKKTNLPQQSRNHLNAVNTGLRSAQRPRSRGARKKLWAVGVAGLLLGVGLWVRFGTIQGVPTAIVLRFVLDGQAREAYFSGQSRLLHDRLNAMGVEEKIKDFYRPQFSSEEELDWFIHQLLYERTGYVGKAYKIGIGDQIRLKTSKDRAFPRWFALATKAEVVYDKREENGVTYVTLANGAEVTYNAMSEIYTIKTLRQLIRQQARSD